MRAMGGRPVLMERYPHGVDGHVVLPEAGARRTRPTGSTTTIVSTPNGTTSRALVVGRPRAHRVGREPRMPRLPRVAGRADDPEHADELRIDLDPQPGVDFDDVRVAAHEVQALLDELGHRRIPEDHGQARHPRLRPAASRAGTRTRSGRRRSRSHASSRAGIPTASPTRGGRKSAASASSSTSTRTRRTRRCSARGACGRARARRCRRRSRGTSSTRSTPTRRRSRRCPDGWPRSATRGTAIDTSRSRSTPLLDLHERDRGQRPARRAVAARLSEDAGRAATRRAQSRRRSRRRSLRG